MFKIGIIGSENSHATSFCKALNLPNAEGKYRYDDARVVAVMGDAESAGKLVSEAGAQRIASGIDDFSDCNAMMITARRGSEHLKYALPFIERGIPVFIDKPFTVSEQDAARLLKAAKKSGALVSGGSACKYAPKVLELKESVAALRAEGVLSLATLSFNIFMDIEYDGFFFYASHLVEMCLEIFGDDILKITALRNGASVTANVVYEDVTVTLLFTGGVFESACTLYTKRGIQHEKIDISTIFDEELEVFIKMLRSGKQPAELERFTRPVSVMNAIYKAYTEE